MYEIEIRPQLDRKFSKLAKKDRKMHEAAMKKAEEISKSPEHYKNLRAPMQHLKRVHIETHFVLTFSVDEKRKRVVLEDFDHHDKIYKK